MKTKNLAALDIGTNSFHLVVVQPTNDGNFTIVDREKEVIRLGEGNIGDIKIIKPKSMERAVNALAKLKGIADSYDAKIRAVATSAVREAHNKDEFIKKVLNHTGIEIEIISGFEEARLIYLGILKAVPLFDERILCIDIGGGSTEFLVGEKSEIIYANSLKIGAVRLSQMFFPDGKVTKERIEDCTNWVKGEIYPVIKSIEHLNFTTIVASSGTAQSAGNIWSANLQNTDHDFTILNNYNLNYEELIQVKDRILSCKTLNDRKKIKGLESKRADIIPAGIIILSTIIKELGEKSLTLSGFALREGIILDSLQKETGSNYSKYLKNIRYTSIEHLALSSSYDIEHSRHVTKLSLILFDKLKSIHNLPDESREYLYAAAMLHDIGYHISHSQHHRHSYYIIRHSKLLGFNDIEIQIIANVARYHRKSHPKKSHKEFMVLNESQRDTIKKLSAILRVSDALDRTHKSHVNELSVTIESKSVIIDLDKSPSEAEIEIWSLNRRKFLFEEVFQRELIIK
jgi:exopolyphosphatase/guanosine-5'-triphosphate,3'-diphosphate pyrophosphatase